MSVDSGTLYIVATPIGNMDDISLRARETLSAVNLIAAEDTRRTRRLLTNLGIKNRLLSCHDHNESARAGQILESLGRGEDVALVSDAGTPLVSDPGYKLLREVLAAGFRVTPVPGASAVLAALSAAGLPSDRFYFEGFLPASKGSRAARLAVLATFTDTLIVFESVHRIAATTAELIATFGPSRRACFCRELTKRHESFYRGTLLDIQTLLGDDPGAAKGEFVLVLEGYNAPAVDASEEELGRVLDVLLASVSVSQAASLAAGITGLPRRKAYQLALARQGEASENDD
ncbi:MAG: 16S rRNA (cytidine(1402)-2'-O)-methyltransferase [Gammaproteobacteria bacterium]